MLENAMRPETQRRIDALHAEIAALIAKEKRHHDRKCPDDNELWRHVAHTRLEMFRHCPQDRQNMREAVAAFRA